MCHTLSAIRGVQRKKTQGNAANCETVESLARPSQARKTRTSVLLLDVLLDFLAQRENPLRAVASRVCRTRVCPSRYRVPGTGYIHCGNLTYSFSPCLLLTFVNLFDLFFSITRLDLIRFNCLVETNSVCLIGLFRLFRLLFKESR